MAFLVAHKTWYSMFVSNNWIGEDTGENYGGLIIHVGTLPAYAWKTDVNDDKLRQDSLCPDCGDQIK
jgi:hypothetical protein